MIAQERARISARKAETQAMTWEDYNEIDTVLGMHRHYFINRMVMIWLNVIIIYNLDLPMGEKSRTCLPTIGQRYYHWRKL